MASRGLGGLRRIVKTEELNQRGMTSRAIAEAVSAGSLMRVARGVYLPRGTGHEHEDLAIACAVMPRGIICLETALRLHQLTTPRADKICVAIPWDTSATIKAPVPLRVSHWREKALRVGVADFQILGVRVRCTDPARTVVDMFRLRGSDHDRSIEALRDYLAVYGRVDLLYEYAQELGSFQTIKAQTQAFMSLDEFRAPRDLKVFKAGAPVSTGGPGERQGGEHSPGSSQQGKEDEISFDDGFVGEFKPA